MQRPAAAGADPAAGEPAPSASPQACRGRRPRTRAAADAAAAERSAGPRDRRRTGVDGRSGGRSAGRAAPTLPRCAGGTAPDCGRAPPARRVPATPDDFSCGDGSAALPAPVSSPATRRPVTRSRSACRAASCARSPPSAARRAAALRRDSTRRHRLRTSSSRRRAATCRTVAAGASAVRRARGAPRLPDPAGAGQRQAAGLVRQRRDHAEAAGGDRSPRVLLRARELQHPPRRARARGARDRRLRGRARDGAPLHRRRLGRRDRLRARRDRGDQPGREELGRASTSGAGDEIVVSHLEHHANIVPWQQLAPRRARSCA